MSHKKVTLRPTRDQEIFAVLRAIRGMSPKDVSQKTYVSASTIRNWRRPVNQGGTRYPQHHTLAAVAKIAGLEFKLVPISDRPKSMAAAE